MLYAVIVSVGLLAAAEDFAPRLETLGFYVSRLEVIEVPAELVDERNTKLEALRENLAGGAADEEAFNSLYNSIDDVRLWLWEHAAAQPVAAEGPFEEIDEGWCVTTPALTLTVFAEDLSMSVRTAAEEWRFAPCGRHDMRANKRSFSLLDAAERTVESFRTGYSVGLTMHLSGFERAPGFELRLTANLIDSEIVFEVAAREPEAGFDYLDWPRPIELGNTAAEVSVIPRMQGMLLPGNWSQPIHAPAGLCNSRSFYMPWWGQIRNGHGVMGILETSDDAGGGYKHPEGGPTRIGPRWFNSLGRLAYLRTIRYVFDDDATYVTMCKRYRRFVQERGHFVSLREKVVRTPALDEVIGKPVVHLGALYHFVREAALFNKERIENNHSLQPFDKLAEGLKKLKASGIEDAYVHLDGWGYYGYDNGHPDVLPVGAEQGGVEGLRLFANTCEEIGYLFAVHDQYRDFYFNAASFDERLVATRLDGSREEHSTWCGGPQTILSPRFAPEYVRRNHDWFAAQGVKVRGAYLDVFAVVPPEESSQPTHPITRSQCAEYRRECFDLLRARGYVVSSEEPADYLVRSLDLVHHGPYATYPNIGGGGACGIPAPLFSLVYHDSILLPWEMGEDGGWGIPKGDAGWLHCLLNAGLPYVGPGASPEQVTRVNEAAALARRCAFEEMTNHEFLDDTHRKQRTTFGDGSSVTVDFDTKEYSIKTGL